MATLHKGDNDIIIIIIIIIIIEIQLMWNVKTRVIPVITGATGTISQSIQKIRERHTRKPRR